MADYYLSGGISETGDRILLSVPWEHKKSELRALCVIDSKEFQDSVVLNASFINGADGKYSIDYPFSQAGLPWKAYLWRETTENSTVKFESSRIPVEAILTKLAELSRKSDEAKVALERVLMTPEDMNGKMFIPSINVRKGEVLGFDDEGNVVTGEACTQIRELFELKPTIEGILQQTQEAAREARNNAEIAGVHSADAADSVSECVNLTQQAEVAKNKADGILQQTKEVAANAKNTAETAVNQAKLSAEEAEASAVRAEEAVKSLNTAGDDLKKAVCYVGCAVKRVEEAEASASNSKEVAEKAATSAMESKESAAESKADAEAAKQSAETAMTAAQKAATSAMESKESAAESKADAEAAKQSAETAMTAAQKAASDAQATLSNVYTKAELDGVDTGAEVTLKMNEIIAQLKDYEEVTGEKLPWEFWEAVMAEFQRWQENPNEVKEWVTTSATESTSPYFSTPASKPIVEFNVVSCVSNVSECGVINIAHDVSAIFLPNVVNAQRMIRGISAEKVYVALPNATRLYGMAVRADAELVVYAPLATNIETAIQRTTKNAKVIAPSATSASYFAQYASEFNNEVDFPKCTNWFAFASGASKYNQATNMESATKADAAFGATAMSPENIAATLDTLPAGKSDGSSKILFSRADGTKLTPLMAVSPYKESVDAAVARGWTVQFDS